MAATDLIRRRWRITTGHDNHEVLLAEAARFLEAAPMGDVDPAEGGPER